MMICAVVLLFSVIFGLCFAVIKYKRRSRRDPLTFPPPIIIPENELMLTTGQIISDHNSANIHPRDNLLCYSSELHRYMFNDEPLTYIDEAVETFFPVFESVKWSEKQSGKTGEPASRIRERWDAESEEALKLGCFVHRQIENSLQHRKVHYSYYYCYVGKSFSTGYPVSISPEMNQYVRFRQAFPDLQPYRSAWVVFDEAVHWVGIVDFLGRGADGRFVLVDWKRSNTFGQELSVPDSATTSGLEANSQCSGSDFVLSDSYGATGLDALSHLPDTPFSRESVHLNLLRLILQRRYGITVDRLQVLLLHSGYKSYHLLDVPLLPDEAQAVYERYATHGL